MLFINYLFFRRKKVKVKKVNLGLGMELGSKKMKKSTRNYCRD